VVNGLEKRGAIFVDEVDEVPEGSILVFSAHGVSPAVLKAAEGRNLNTIDATCPLVTKVHREVQRFAAEDYDILLIGHEGHEEVEGTAGEAPEHVQLVDGRHGILNVTVRDPEKVIWLSQTTLSVDETYETVNALREKFPTLQNPPSEVKRLYEYTRENEYDVVYTRYKEKRHAKWRNLGSRFANRVADALKLRHLKEHTEKRPRAEAMPAPEASASSNATVFCTAEQANKQH
jgi:(E)-4-hydroxy-3-methyl-but-2-enyl pyrophosphate reductase